MKKTILTFILLLLFAASSNAERIDAGFFTCDIPDAETWRMYDAESGAKNIIRADGRIAISVALIDPKGASLYEVADSLARLHGSNGLKKPAWQEDDERTVWEYTTNIWGRPVYAQIFAVGKKVAYVTLVGNTMNPDAIGIFNSIEFKEEA